MEVKGRDLVAGLPKTITITSQEIREAMSDPLSTIVDAVRTTLERCPPELAADLRLLNGVPMIEALRQTIVRPAVNPEVARWRTMRGTDTVQAMLRTGRVQPAPIAAGPDGTVVEPPAPAPQA